MPSFLDTTAHGLPQPVRLDAEREGDELVGGDALAVALRFFDGFDRRVSNQRIVESHAVDSAKGGENAPRLRAGENCSEGGSR